MFVSYIKDDIHLSTAKYWALYQHTVVVAAYTHYSHVHLLRLPLYIAGAGVAAGAISGNVLSLYLCYFIFIISMFIIYIYYFIVNLYIFIILCQFIIFMLIYIYLLFLC